MYLTFRYDCNGGYLRWSMGGLRTPNWYDFYFDDAYMDVLRVRKHKSTFTYFKCFGDNKSFLVI